MSEHHDGTHHDSAHAHRTHDHTADLDWETLGPFLEQSAELNASYFEQAAGWLGELFAEGGRGPGDVGRLLDVGSGPGVASCLFAGAFPEAEVVAVDGSQALLDRTAARAVRLGLADRVRTRCAELPDGFDAVGTADLIWSSHALHHLGDQRAAVQRLARSLRPGGVLALAEGGLSARFLPRDVGFGRPGLQARLEAINEDWFTRMRAGLPDAKETVEDWPALLAAGGLIGAGSRTFLVDLPAPLDAAARLPLHTELSGQRERFAEDLDAEDRGTLDRLLDPEDPAGLLLRPDVFVLRAFTVHTARACRPGAAC
ncbi:class I SAM-dependent methyltransferase [Streptomyces sp. H27-D2]|uniref:class I SAM-dependent methyltransferase n=1 Tax=Streptomyces sp. H27-D2 TaxID=3046304 RepID=UPI002DB59F53|nr:class I SAM-dependent methyltransferase [Streptomyces sp. H27-D2]MEC4018730.1 class I SAM-dependent methyltransferase [Streptomyces sp. H27-D2]